MPRLARLLALLLAAGCSPGPDDGPGAVADPAATEAATWSPARGERVLLAYPTGGAVWLAVDRDAAEAMTSAAGQGEEAALRGLAEGGRIYSVPEATGATVVDPGLNVTEVEVEGRRAFAATSGLMQL